MKEVPLAWDEKQDSSFKALCDALATSLVLIYPNFDKMFVLFTDSGNNTVGTILVQINENKVDNPIAYYSKMLSKAKRNHSVTKREYLAENLAIKNFPLFL